MRRIIDGGQLLSIRRNRSCTVFDLRIISSDYIWIVNPLPSTAKCCSDIVHLYEDHLILPFGYVYLQLQAKEGPLYTRLQSLLLVRA